jgi:hypothetical protein
VVEGGFLGPDLTYRKLGNHRNLVGSGEYSESRRNLHGQRGKLQGPKAGWLLSEGKGFGRIWNDMSLSQLGMIRIDNINCSWMGMVLSYRKGWCEPDK